MERVLEVGEIVRADARVDGRDLGLDDPDAIGQTRGLDARPGPGDRIALELDAEEPHLGEALGHRDEPSAAAAMEVDHARAAGQLDHEVRHRGEDLGEEDGDVLAGQPFDRGPVAVRPRADGFSRPEHLGHPVVVEARDDRMRELAPEVLGPMLVEQDDRRRVVEVEPFAVEVDDGMRIGSDRPGAYRIRVAAARVGELVGREPSRTAGVDALEQSQLEPEVDDPGPVESG